MKSLGRSTSRPAQGDDVALPDVAAIAGLPHERLLGLSLHLAALQTAIATRLVSAPPGTEETHAPDDDELLTSDQAGALLQLPKGYVAELGRRGELPRVTCGKYVRFRRGDLRAWVARHTDGGR